MGTASVEAVKVPPVPGVQKPPCQVGKRFRLVAAGPPGRKPGDLPWHRGLPGMAFAAVQALRWLTATTSSRDLTRMVKERGAAAHNRVGAVVEQLKGWNAAALTDPDERNGEQFSWQLAG
jgi:hypothetical protein